ncbi:MAG: hypothetical protein PHE50_05840 [Dehalococcoidales bacterium]|nr:hypothetical protein [Dehalococcoidales bacterium]
MTDLEIVAMFRELAALLEKKKENWFKIRSYRKVADEIEQRQPDLKKLAETQRLREIPGVGEAIEKKIIEMLSTGKLQLIERLKQEAAEKTDEQTAKS